MPDYSRTRIQFRRGTSSELNAANPILGKGEPAFATDTNALKIGDGSTAYVSLSSISGGGEGGGGLDSVVQDTTPQLGGTLDALSNNISSVGIITATSFVKSSGTSSQFLKADGSIDTSTYLTSISNIDTTNFNSSAIVTESEGISSNDNDTTIPTSAAVKDYVDNSGGASLSQEDVEDYVGDMVDGGTETGISVTYDDDNGKIDFVVASQTDENFTTDDHNKLDGIEAGADVTDTDNVTSAGALMDSEVTNLSQVKAFDSSAYATAAQGTKADSAQQPPSEGAFANGDKTKLDGIETSADVTDTTNVTSAGALMDSEVTNLAQVKAFDSSDYATAAQGSKADTAQQPPSEGAFADGDKTKLNSIEASADVTDTANVTSAGALMDSELASIANVKALDQSVIAGASPNLTTTNMTDASDKRFMTDAQEAKLDSVESSADVTDTANVTSAGALMDSELASITNVKALDQSVVAGSAPSFLTTNMSDAANKRLMTDAQESKLDSVETSADVTDTTNVVAALSSGTGVSISAGGVISVSSIALTTVQAASDETAHLALTAEEGDVVVRSDENKSYVHNGGSAGTMSDYTLLLTPTDAVLSVAGNTGAVTAAQIKTAYEGESDTNAFTDADHSKLDGIEASADVTDTANVTSAGALMDSEITNLAQVKAFDSSDYLTSFTETNDLSTAVTWTNVPDANITQGSVTQHQAALSITESQISDLQSYLTSETFTSVVQDTTPQLGGSLDVNGNNITGNGAISVSGNLTTHGNNVNIGSASYGLAVSSSASTLGSHRLQILGTETVINQAGASLDFRVEGDTDQNALFVNASSDSVGVGIGTPTEKLTVVGGINNLYGWTTHTKSGSSLGAGVSNGFNLWLSDSDEETLTTSNHYLVQMTTFSTGSRTGASYLVWYESSGSTWNVRPIGQAQNVSNAPLLTESSGKLVGYCEHASGQSFRYNVKSYFTQDADSRPHSMGADYHWQRLVDDLYFTDGNVGIGTDSPSHKLSIADSTLLGGILVSGGGTPGLSLIDTTDDSSHGVYGSDNGILLVSADITSVGGSSSAIKLGVQNATQAVVTSSGVGIGTETPQHKLDVAGMGRFVHADGVCGLQIEDTGGSGIHIGDCALGSVTSYAGIKHSNHGSSDYMMISNGITTFISAVDNGAVVLRGGGNDANSEIQIKDVGAGSVGIIFNEAGSDRDIRMEGTGNVNLFRLDASTNRIGIGTGTPAQLLDVTTTETEAFGINLEPSSTPASSGDYQSLITENRSDSIVVKHLENTANGSSTLVFKNLIRYGADFVSIDDAYNAGLGVTYYPKFKVNTDTGAITFADAFTFPTADGSANQILQTDGAGNVTWEDASGGGISNVVEDTTPQLGGDLDANGNDIDMGTNVITDAKVGYWVPSNTSAVSNSTQVTNLVMITQSNYDALGSYDANTLYFIT